jgi:hypothetical protein
MGESPDETITWENALAAVASCLRKEFEHQLPFKDEGDVSPDIVALRDAFNAFPVSTDVLLIDASGTQAIPPPRLFLETEEDFGSTWTLIAHHLADAPSKQIRFHGTRTLGSLHMYFPLLAERFGLDEENYGESIRSLSFSGCWASDSSEIVDFMPFDIRARAAVYGSYLANSLFMSHQQELVRRFKKEIDFGALYGLSQDPVLPLEEWTRIDPITALFVDLYSGKPPTFEERQAAVCDIQLIPKVPKDIQLTFRRAKDAYILGYFRYDFFTIAVHYSSLALEAAIKARWSTTLPQRVTLSCGPDKTEISFPSHTKILNLSLQRGWKPGQLFVDGKRFPSSTEKLLDWLEHEKIVSKWERKCLRNGLDMRNALSHVEHSSTDTPSSDKLRFAANLTNKLFHNLP